MKDYKRIYFNNYDSDEILSKKDFEEILNEDYEDEIADMSENRKEELFYSYYSDTEETAFTCVMNDFASYFADKVVLAKGSVGRWNGTNSGIEIIGLEEYSDFRKFFNSFSKDCDYFKFGVTRDNKLFLQCSHHDGTNYVEFKILTKKGEFLLEDYFNGERLQNYKEYDLLNKLWNSKVYSEKLNKNSEL